MENHVKVIGVLTSGGDAPGMNAAVRAVVYQGLGLGLKVLGVRHGYSGLLEEKIKELSYTDVANIERRGGTILGTSRCPEMLTEEGQQKAVEICRKYGIEGLIIIGGDGSFRGAQKLSKHGLNVIGVPGTIDGDIGCTDYTIGFDTAINAAMQALDRIRDTDESHECCSIVEVMGRKNGNLALWSGMAGGAEQVFVPEEKVPDPEQVTEDIRRRKGRGQLSYIVVNAEGVGGTEEMAKAMEKATGIHTRSTVLSFVQRGGSPTCRERVYATMMGQKAVELLAEGKTNRVVVHNKGEFSDVSIDDVLASPSFFYEELYRYNQALNGQSELE